MDTDIVDVRVEPKPGHTDDEAIQALEDLGGTNIETLVPGIISARLPKERIGDIDCIAHVERKAKSEPT